MLRIVLWDVKSEWECLVEYNWWFCVSIGIGWVWGKLELDVCVIFWFVLLFDLEVDVWILDWDYVGLVDEVVYMYENVVLV